MNKSIIKEDIEKYIVDSIKEEVKKLEGRTVLISGGAGFLGSYILSTIDYLNKHIFEKPCSVISVDNFITGKKRKILESINKKHIQFIQADIKEPLTLPRKIDYIIHAAGIASPIYYNKYPLETIEVAIQGTINLLELARKKKIKSFLYFSSSEIYGNPPPEFIPTPETYNGNVSPIGPRACYDESKRVGETLCITYHRVYKVPVKIVRPFNIFGPGMYPDDFRVIPNYISRGFAQKPLVAYDKGDQTRTFCYISDAVIGFLKTLLSKRNGEVYNIGNQANEISMIDLAILISQFFPNSRVSIHPHPKNYPIEDTKRRCPDITKSKQYLGYEPQVKLPEGIKRVIRWYKAEFPQLTLSDKQ